MRDTANRRARIAGEGIGAPAELAAFIDHTVLGLEASDRDVAQACDDALRYGFAAVCVREKQLGGVVRRLGDRGGPLPIAVADFPRGDGTMAGRAEEVRRLVGTGAREVDVVFPLPALTSRRYVDALRDLEAVVQAARAVPVKVILETGSLTVAEKGAASAIAKAAGAAWVKTSTGFGAGGATEEDVSLLRALVGEDVGVKASGGIRTAADALRMVRAGASRIGSSASVAIVTGKP
ncbi:MAG TPA: deoxyribose-phosphate aldolase [Anaeromyxobacteraceae bacterium]|nr:deoxyribose-phosphate aldolase [Anaeromyxobacteraceae bacterium]